MILTKNVLAKAHKKFQRGQHPEIYLLTLKRQDKTKMELPLDMVSISASSCRTIAIKKIWNRQRREVCDLCMMKIIKIFPGICYLPSIFASVVLLFIFQSIIVYKGWRTFDFDEIQ